MKHSRDFEKGENPSLDEYLPGLRPPLEAQLIDLADEIAYNTADLDDAFSAGLFELSSIRSAVPEFERRYQEVEGQFPGASENERFQEVVRGLVDWLVSGFIQGTMEAATEAAVTSAEEVREHPRRIATFTLASQATNRELKQFLHHQVYYSELMMQERRRSARMLAELFEFYVAHPDKLPPNYVDSLATNPVHRVVCDYIAGMTDGFFLRQYQNAFAGF